VTIAVSGGTSTKSYNHQDGLGSIVALSSSTGAVGDKYTYGVYGETANLTGNTFRYSGRRLDAETGLYYYRARYYSPKIGRFLQNDPIGYTGGINLYAYVGNDPLNLTDPSGLMADQVGSDLWNQTLKPIGQEIANDVADPLTGLQHLGDAAAGLTPVAAELPQMVSGVIGAIRVLGAALAPDTQGNPFAIPDNYVAQPSDKGGGTRYVDPENSHNSVRVMPGTPNSPNPAQQNPYVIDMRSGSAIDVSGNRVSPSSPEAHVPQSQYTYKP